MNKYHEILGKILSKGKDQINNKGSIKYLLNQTLELRPIDLLQLFEGHGLARKKLKDELNLFMAGERSTKAYRDVGVAWWDYCGPILVNSYPTYFEQLPKLIEKINKEYIKMGGIGSGYPSDPKTKEFLTNFTYAEMPDFVRKSWNTVQKLK